MDKSKLFSLVSLVSLIITCCLLSGAVANAAQKPLDVIKQSNQQVLEILKDKEKVDEPTEKKMLEIINGVTNFEMISQRATNLSCKKLTPQQCKKFGEVFIRLLRVSSIKKMGRYRADKFDYLGEEINQNSAIVKTIAYYKDEKAELNYHLELTGGDWKIVNYVVDDIDTVRNYKKQFLRLFRKMSFDGVIERLESKIADYNKENRE